MFKAYYRLTKPGIIYGNLLAAVAGFLLASQWSINLFLLIYMVVGLSTIIASGCVFNNILDRKIDSKMDRTRKRSLVTGKISIASALVYGTALGITGFFVLYFFTNTLTTLIAFTGWFFYVVVYGVAKRGTVYSTIIGSVAGAVPPVVGYVSVTNQVDFLAVFLFLILVVWQMPHFYAIAIFRKKDYETAGLPVLSVKEGIDSAKKHIIFYIVLFTILTSSVFVFGFKGYIYLIPILYISIYWLFESIDGLKQENSEVWARKMFKTSLLVLLVFCITISI